MSNSKSPKYNAVQQTFALNWLSNILANKKADSTESLQSGALKGIKEVLGITTGSKADATDLVGEWDLLWGPVVYSHKGSGPHTGKVVADNTMFLVNSKPTGSQKYGDTFILGIAGTNPISPYGWVIEDFNTRTQEPWPFVSAQESTSADLKISTGTSIGVNALLTLMKDPTNGSIVEYLRKIAPDANPQSTLTVTGHSLGGALSASLALALKNMQTQDPNQDIYKGFKGTWDPNLKMVVGAMATAGATPGNANFARYFDEQIGARTIRLWNALDVVPHAWELDMLVQSVHLYYPYIKPSKALLLLIDAVIEASSQEGVNDYQQIMSQIPPLNGSVNMAIATSDTLANLTDHLPEGLLTTLLTSIVKYLTGKEITPLEAEAIVKALEEWLKNKESPALVEALEKLLDKVIGTVDGITPKVFIEGLPNILLFLIQLAFQHVQVYIQLMGINEFVDRMKVAEAQIP